MADDGMASLLKSAYENESAASTFIRAQVRVSSIGMCGRKVVAQAIGLADSSIPWEHNEGGHMLQGAAFRRIRKQYPMVEEEVSIPTSAPCVFTHPDIFVSEIDLGCQVKSCDAFKIEKYLRGELWYGKPALPASYNVDQVLLEWAFWRKTGFCVTEAGMAMLHRHFGGLPRAQRVEQIWTLLQSPAFLESDFEGAIFRVPERYELLYLARDDFGHTCVSIPVPWDTERAERLEAEFDARHNAIAFGELPEKCKDSPNWECGMTKRGKPPQVCALYESCWGCKYVPRPY